MTEVTTNPDQSKFVLHTNLPLPCSCIACGRSQRNSSEPFLDFNVSLDFVGALLLCLDCVNQIAREHVSEYDLERLNHYDTAVASAAGAQDRIDELENENHDLRSKLAAYDLILADFYNNSPTDTPSIEDVAEPSGNVDFFAGIGKAEND